MQKNKIITLVLLGLFVVGSAVIVYRGRPVMKIQKDQIAANEPEPAELSYRLVDVEAHNTPANCWAAINGQVYDLSTWVSRHPGGAKPIEWLCGKDGSEAFNKKHGNSSGAQAALALLKIGKLE